ncbi:MAG: ABC transporter permease [Polyangiaceae bacterium]
MSPLHTKLFRDAVRLRGQAFTIALVVLAGVASWVALRSTYDSLHDARDAYYERQRFGEIFASCTRAPLALADRIAAIEGVTGVSASVVEPLRLRVEDAAAPPVGVLVSLPTNREPAADVPHLMRGRTPDPGREDEGVLLDAFAKAHKIELGAVLTIVVSGRQREVRIVGTAVSPDYLFAVAPGDVTADEKGFGVLWMDEDAARAMTGMGGAFNHLSLRLAPENTSAPGSGTETLTPKREAAVRDEVDRLLAPWGGAGALGRADQPSNRVLDQELGQLKGMALVTPIIFLGVAAFLLNTVLARLITLERPEIASLRALGYTGFEVALHYVELCLVIVTGGALGGVLLGAYFGRLMTDLYAQYFHFPEPPFNVAADVVAVGVLVSVGAALIGAVGAARRIVKLPPAEAMRPPAPAVFKRGLLERSGVLALLSPSSKMVARELARRPGRALLSIVALSFSLAINVIGSFNGDLLDDFITQQFTGAMREDLTVSFRRAVDPSAVGSLAAQPGVTRAEPLRMTPIELSKGHIRRERILIGHPDHAVLRRLIDRYGEPVALPEHGLLIDDYTASLLGVKEGDLVTMRVLEGERRTVEVPVGRVFDGLTGIEAHATLDEHAALTGESGITSVLVTTDERGERELIARSIDMPEVMSVTRRADALARFEALTGATMTTMTLILSAFAAIIAIGVVYNDARIALSSQARELASLRVLGFTRAEVSRILLGQSAVVVVCSIIPGLYLGRLGAELVMSTSDPELYRFPTTISTKTYVVSALIVIGAAIVSSLLVRRRVDHLDLVEVLKTRD